MRALLSALWLALACSSVHTTLSKSDAKKAASKTLLEKTQFSDKPVQDRGLVVTDLRAEDVVLEHRSYCSAKARERHFTGDVLGYVTPWNSHGYDIAKVFGGKFTQISPVWLQLKRRGREMFEVTGLHDVDQGWMRAVRKQSKGLRIVPRLLFEDWTHEDFRNVLDSEDEIEELSKTMVQIARSQHFDGFVVEVWSQLLSQKHVGLIHMLTHVAEALHQARLLAILVIPPAVTPGTDQLGMFTHKEFEQLAPVLDGFSLMTYDYPTAQQPGPNAPLSWVRACVQVLDPKSKWRSKILLGLNFYGMDYAASRDAREPVIGARYIQTLKDHRPRMVWDSQAAEHFFEYKNLCRCGWRWPGSWASGCPSGSWARAWTTSTTCSRPSPGADMCFLSDGVTDMQNTDFSVFHTVSAGLSGRGRGVLDPGPLVSDGGGTVLAGGAPRTQDLLPQPLLAACHLLGGGRTHSPHPTGRPGGAFPMAPRVQAAPRGLWFTVSLESPTPGLQDPGRGSSTQHHPRTM
ncbi:chitinase domain-containing protein 1 isoform X1 [Diceros bicornis minor]|uniref:chitinase domain-containing protein 1 isoform X1 n=1 Tax=Diceros bicornis minor TaxID=77932 RepID=UPI0026EE398C|nr:chitinase domain-containing protein 1 isoform X1 [Diceros bicornis minor]XP_058382054.1 chitinase domain-containing protein 1 isoform X1 [Diceros bicornis minor]